MTAPSLLVTDSLSRDFGGVHAVRDVSLEIGEGRIHAVIGPNGAGKTTLINLLSGDIKPSHGRIRYRGADITAASPHQIARLGIGRTYQQTHVIGDMSCLENCRLGAQRRNWGRDSGQNSGRNPERMQFFRAASSCTTINEAAGQALAQVGLQDRSHAPAASLSHGEQRQLEIAMVLATGPSVLLLDEPLAGMGVGDSRRMIDLLKELSHSHTVVLIEHDMDAVFELADILTVMVDGQILKTGSPDQVRADVAVQQAYLGEME